MRPFRFRAAAGLALRRRQEDLARQRLAWAETAHARAAEQAHAAARATAHALEAWAAAFADGIDGGRAEWHRSWITRRQREAGARRRAAADSAGAVERAAADVQLAHQQRRALERLRDRAWRRHQLAAARHELAAMNELATLRYLAQAAEGGAGDERAETGDGGNGRRKDQHDD